MRKKDRVGNHLLTSPWFLPPSLEGKSVNWVMEIVQGIVTGVNTVIRQAGAMLKVYLPLHTFLDKNIIANAVLPLIGIG